MIQKIIEDWIEKNHIPNVNENGYLIVNREDLTKLLVKYKTEQLSIGGVNTRTFRFSGMKCSEKFVKLIQAPDRETAIAYFELTYPDLTWRTSTELD